MGRAGNGIGAAQGRAGRGVAGAAALLVAVAALLAACATAGPEAGAPSEGEQAAAPPGDWEVDAHAVEAALASGRLAEAQDALVAAVGEAARFGRDDPRLGWTVGLVARATAATASARPGSVDALFDRLVAAAEREAGPAPWLAFELRRRRALWAAQRGRPMQGALELRALVDEMERALGPGSAETIGVRTELARTLWAAGRPAEARTALDAAREDAESGLGRDHPTLAQVLLTQAAFALEAGEPGVALRLLAQAEPIVAGHEGGVGPLSVGLLETRAAARRLLGDFDAAAEAAERAVERIETLSQGQPGAPAISIYVEAAQSQYARGDLDAAEAHARRALQLTTETLGPDTPGAIPMLQLMGDVAIRREQFRAAVPFFQRMFRLAARAGSAESPAAVVARLRLAYLAAATGRPARAEHIFRDVARRVEQRGGEGPALGSVLNEWAWAGYEHGSLEEAERRARRAVALLRAEPQSPAYASALDTLGAILTRRGQHAEARALLEEALGIMGDLLPRPERIQVLEHYEAALRGLGETTQADAVAARRRALAPAPDASGAEGGSRVVESRALHYRFEPPSTGWVAVEPGRLRTDADLAYARSRPVAMFALVARETADGGAAGTDEVVGAVRDAMQRAGTVMSISHRPHARDGLEGTWLEVRVRRDEGIFDHVLWTLQHGGIRYQLEVWSPVGPEGTPDLRATAKELFDGFEILEPGERETARLRRAAG